MKSQYMNTFRCAVVHDVPSLSIFSKMGLLLALDMHMQSLRNTLRRKQLASGTWQVKVAQWLAITNRKKAHGK